MFDLFSCRSSHNLHTVHILHTLCTVLNSQYYEKAKKSSGGQIMITILQYQHQPLWINILVLVLWSYSFKLLFWGFLSFSAVVMLLLFQLQFRIMQQIVRRNKAWYSFYNHKALITKYFTTGLSREQVCEGQYISISIQGKTLVGGLQPKHVC